MNTVLAILIIAGLVAVVGGFVKARKARKEAKGGSGGSRFPQDDKDKNVR